MSGSGSSVFGLFSSAAGAQRAVVALAPLQAVYVTDLQPGDPADLQPGDHDAPGQPPPEPHAPK
jgi:hypothetical protein